MIEMDHGDHILMVIVFIGAIGVIVIKVFFPFMIVDATPRDIPSDLTPLGITALSIPAFMVWLLFLIEKLKKLFK